MHWESADMRALRIHEQCIERLTGRHEQTVSLGAAEADITADFRQQDLANTLSVGRENMDPVIAFPDPTGAGPDVPIDVGADAISHPREAAILHLGFRRNEFAAIPQFRSVDYIPHGNVH